MPFFSVIIPLYNKEDYISECLESALNQTFKDYEIIIVNDGSTDNSIKLVENFKSDKIRLFHQENQGASKARNNATNFSTGKYLAFLDADDIWKTNHLACLYESISTFKDCGIYTNNYFIKHSNSITAPAKFNFKFNGDKPFILDDFFKASLHETVVWTSACSIKKSKFIDYGMFNPVYLSSQDLDMWIRIALNEAVVFHPKRTMIYNKSIENSLGKIEDNDARFILLSSFKNKEKENPSLKAYLDLKRYGLALRTKINGEEKIHSETVKLIDIRNLSVKQKLLLRTPAFLLMIMNNIRPYLIKNRLYLAIFKS
ncbi:glycosyltransferase family 2 protein [Winogradskyella alexanderae]|uniref:Glycosyltransferase family 2 protein n=1 Tax=Winogradskyella alexanderae TaxID=2877123 RepID=A0ABS7XTQ1_9FLAO|nr:glycosyltransferase family A protein [Winogradskyella alexanderae]MCA0132854.1 glycosyltransferase family 2 protein [Winogradskyella alexanderae]